MKKINERLKELRTRLGLTQLQSAQKVGVKQQNWARWESGDVLPSAEMIYQICATHNESADWLLGLSPNRKDGVKAKGEKNPQPTAKLITGLRTFRKEMEAGIARANTFLESINKLEAKLGGGE